MSSRLGRGCTRGAGFRACRAEIRLGFSSLEILSQQEPLIHHGFPTPAASSRLSGRALFITWHLYGSLPHNLYPPPDKLSAGQAFVWMDRYLDSARGGPLYLKQEAVARLVAGSVRYGAEQRQYYDLQAFVVMANHVHLLALPHISPSRFLQTLKGYTAREANRLLGRTGQPFWQAESYDHWVRDDRELERIKAYIENNPVKAGLVTKADDYPWSSAARKAETTLGSAGSTACATNCQEVPTI